MALLVGGDIRAGVCGSPSAQIGAAVGLGSVSAALARLRVRASCSNSALRGGGSTDIAISCHAVVILILASLILVVNAVKFTSGISVAIGSQVSTVGGDLCLSSSAVVGLD